MLKLAPNVTYENMVHKLIYVIVPFRLDTCSCLFWGFTHISMYAVSSMSSRKAKRMFLSLLMTLMAFFNQSPPNMPKMNVHVGFSPAKMPLCMPSPQSPPRKLSGRS